MFKYYYFQSKHNSKRQIFQMFNLKTPHFFIVKYTKINQEGIDFKFGTKMYAY